MPIEHTNGGTTITGDSIDFLSLCALKGAVHLELKGMRMSRGRSATAIAKERFNIKGSKQKVYEVLCKMVNDLRPQQEHRSTDPVTGREVREVGGEEVN